jgi:hypothetical protein
MSPRPPHNLKNSYQSSFYDSLMHSNPPLDSKQHPQYNELEQPQNNNWSLRYLKPEIGVSRMENNQNLTQKNQMQERHPQRPITALRGNNRKNNIEDE